MNIIFKDYDYQDNIHVLVRTYENQAKKYKADEQCAAEILFLPELEITHLYCVSWLPHGCVKFIKEKLVPIINTARDKGLNWNIQVSNELPDQLGVSTDCHKEFTIRFTNEVLPLLVPPITNPEPRK